MRRKNTVDTFPVLAVAIVFLLAILLFGPDMVRSKINQAKDAAENLAAEVVNNGDIEGAPVGFDYSAIPEYSGEPYIIVNDGEPFFAAEEITSESFEHYGDLDKLGRCTVAFGCFGMETVPPEGDERGDISSVTPTGYVQGRYKFIDDGNDATDEPGYLYNRCHLIAWCISDEDANPNNLITGTRYLNVDGMWIWEEQVQDYIYECEGNHVMYRVTPIFEGLNKVASGVLMEAYSVEDNGAFQFCVFCYNVQPGVSIDYASGANSYNGGVFLDKDASSVIYFG